MERILGATVLKLILKFNFSVLLLVAPFAVEAGAVFKAFSASAQPLVYNLSSGTKGCGLRLMVLTDVPELIHVADVSANVFKNDAGFMATIKGGYSHLVQGSDGKILPKPVQISALNLLNSAGEIVQHDALRAADQPPEHLMGRSEIVQTLAYLVDVASEREVMVGFTFSDGGTERLFRFKPKFDDGDLDVFRRCVSRLHKQD